MTTFTPGPWVSHEEMLTPMGLHVAGRSPTVHKGNHVIAAVNRFLNHRLNENVCAEAEANARLIAMAPEMYHSLLRIAGGDISEEAIEQAFQILGRASTPSQPQLKNKSWFLEP